MCYDFCYDFPSHVESLFVELNLRKSKWLLFGTYYSPAQNDQHFFSYTDFHKLVLTILKTSFGKNKPYKILCRDYKKFNSESFNEDLQNILSTTQINIC